MIERNRIQKGRNNLHFFLVAVRQALDPLSVFQSIVNLDGEEMLFLFAGEKVWNVTHACHKSEWNAASLGRSAVFSNPTLCTTNDLRKNKQDQLLVDRCA